MADVLTSSEYLTVASIPLATPAWRVQNLGALLSISDVRGADRLIPHANGGRPYRRRITVTQRVFPVVVNGFANREGTPYSNARIGLVTNVEVLKAAFVPPATTAGTVTATWVRPSPLSNKSGAVHVIAFDHTRQRGPHVAEFALVLSIPGGDLA